MYLCSCVPFLTMCFHGFLRAHSPHPMFVRTFHAPSLTCCICHTFATNSEILLASVCNCGQGNTVRPTIGTPPNGLRFSLYFLQRRSLDMLVSSAPSTHSYIKSLIPYLERNYFHSYMRLVPIIRYRFL